MTDSIRRPLVEIPEAERRERLAALGVDLDRLPHSLNAEERKAAMEPGQPPVAVPPVSPTGAPVIPASSILWKLAIALVGLAAIIQQADFFPATTLDETIAGAIVSLGALLGIVSPGIRKPS